MTAPELPEAFGTVLPAYEGQPAHETALKGTNCRGWKSGTAKLKITDAINDHLAETLFGDFPDHRRFLLSYRTSYLMNPAKAATKNTTLNKTSIPQ